MPFGRILDDAWRWVAETGINLALLILIALLIPRAGRFANRIIEGKLSEGGDTDETKTRLAIANVGINIAQIIAFFLLLVFFLQQVGFSLAGAAIPATVVSAAIGFGAQSIIADFLAGFFILTEKQFGVGDWVAFEGGGVSVEGTVIQITMRSTYIRTIEEATISIPNSVASVSINYSNYFSSAKVVMPVPLLGSTSAEDAVKRAEAAARKALEQPETARNLIGELDVHPAVQVNPPATVGMPWTMDVRFLIRTEPLSQWRVERAIRVAVLNEFWDEYGSATTMEGTRLDRIVDHTKAAEQFPTTFMHRIDPERAMTTASGSDAMTRIEAAAAEAKQSAEEAAKAKALVDPAVAHLSDGAAAADGEITDADVDPATDTFSVVPQDKKQRLTFGGRVRVSTVLLLGAFAILIIARGLTLAGTEANPNGGGVFAPPPRVTAPAPTPTPVQPVAPAPETTTTVETTEPTEPEDTPDPGNPEEDQLRDELDSPVGDHSSSTTSERSTSTRRPTPSEQEPTPAQPHADGSDREPLRDTGHGAGTVNGRDGEAQPSATAARDGEHTAG